MLGSLLRVPARAALASPFILLGYEAARNPGLRARHVEKLGLPEPDLMVRIDGAVMVVAGTTLALGIRPRLSALALLAALVPTTYAGHAFWEVDDEQSRTQQRIHFLKNVAMCGGLLAVLATPPARRGDQGGDDDDEG